MDEPELMSSVAETSAPAPAPTQSIEDRAIRILTFTTLYPNAIKPQHGVFVENRLRHLLKSGRVEARVVAPVPWLPSENRMFGNYADLAGVPMREQRHGIFVDHPRYPVIPKIGMSVAPLLLYRAAKRHIDRLIREGVEFDVIDAHYFYPDGVAAAMLGRQFNKPVTITARGSDINLIAGYALPRRMIKWAAETADGVASVCEALKHRMSEIGIQNDKIRVLRNGVDLEMFHPVADREKLRERLGLTGFTLLLVGNLIPRKSHDLVIKALVDIPDAKLLIAGEGPEEVALRRLSARLGVGGRVQFLGSVPHERLIEYYNAADILVLASSREGWANVLLEAMACGTPVVASNVWGTPEVVATAEAGLLMQERNPRALVNTVRKLRSSLPDRHETRAYACLFSWEATTLGQIEMFQSIHKNFDGFL